MFDIPAARMIFSAVDRTAGPIKSALGRLKWFNAQSQSTLKKASTASMKFGAGLGATAATVAGVFLSARGETEDALGGTASMGVKNLKALEEASTKFSNNFSRVDRVAFLAAAYDIKSGMGSLSDEGVAAMTRLAAMTGVATKATTGQMTGLFAQAYNIYGKLFKTPEEFGQAFSAGLSDAVQRFRTDGKQMADGLANIQGIATDMGVSMSEQLAVLGMARNTFGGGAEAGTAYKGVMQELISAGKKLGTSFTDSNGKALSFAQILRKLEHAQEGALAQGRGAEFKQALSDAFGKDNMKLISAFMGKSAELKKSIDGIAEASKKGETHTNVMAKAMETGSGRAAALLTQQLSNLADKIGAALSPAFQSIAEHLGPIIVRMQAWAEKNPEMIRTIGTVAGVVSGLAVGIGAATVVTWAWNTAMAGTARMIIGGLVKAIAWVIPLVWKFTLAMLANPFVLIAVGIVAIVAAIFIFRKELLQAWNWVKGATRVAWDAVVGTVSRAWDGILAGLSGIWNSIKAGINQLIDWLVPDLLVDAGVGLVTGLWDGIKSVWATLQKWFGDAVNALTGWMPDWVKEKLGFKVQGEVSGSDSTTKQVAGGTSTPAQILRQAQETRVRAESKTRIELDLKNAPGLAVSRVDKSGSGDLDLALAGANFGAAF